MDQVVDVLNLDSLAAETSKEFSDYVRHELNWHYEQKNKIQIVDLTIQNVPSKHFDQSIEATLLVKASTICYRFYWAYRARDGKATQNQEVSWMGEREVLLFAKIIR